VPNADTCSEDVDVDNNAFTPFPFLWVLIMLRGAVRVAVRVVNDETDTMSVFIMTIDRISSSSSSKGGDKDTDLLDDWDMLLYYDVYLYNS